MWIIIFFLFMIGSAAAVIYLMTRFKKSTLLMKVVKGSKRKAILIGALCVFGIGAILFLTMGVWNLGFVVIHFLIFFLAAEGIGRLINRIRKKQPAIYLSGLLAVITTVIYLTCGWYLCHHIFATHYELHTEKINAFDDGQHDNLRIVGFADSHVGTTFHGEEFKNYVARMNEEKPDLVVIAGDFVDDGTSYEDMKICCEALGTLNTTYGVYYSPGNHDGGYYGSTRGYTFDEMVKELGKNGVGVLLDDIVKITDDIYLIGRLDVSRYERRSMAELMTVVPGDAYTIVLDHEPTDYEAEAEASPDLVLSGHTHGGQALVLNIFIKLIGGNDALYGSTHLGDTDFIVTSGLSDWAFQFKTGCASEYFVIDVSAG